MNRMLQNTENYNVQWKSFGKYLKEFLFDMGSSKLYSDVTLVCNDNIKINSHRFILSSCSPLLEKLLRKDNSVVILDNVDHEDLELVLDYLYFGEVYGSPDQLVRILNVADILQIKAIQKLGGQNTPEETNKALENNDEPKTNIDNIDEGSKRQPIVKAEPKKIMSCHKCKFETYSDDTFKVHMENSHKTVKVKYKKHKPSQPTVNSKGCSICQRTFDTDMYLARHFMKCSKMKASKILADLEEDEKTENELSSNTRYPCIFCDSTFVSTPLLRKHMKTDHSPNSDFKI